MVRVNRNFKNKIFEKKMNYNIKESRVQRVKHFICFTLMAYTLPSE